MSRSSRWIVVVVVLALVAVLLAPFVWSQITEGKAPPPLGLETSGTPTDSVEDPAPGPFEVDGTWVVAGGSEAGYRVHETGSGASGDPVVATTADVGGHVVVRGGEAQSAEITTQTAGVTTGDAALDRAYREALEVEAYPSVIFTLTAPVDVSELERTTEPVVLEARGTLTVRDVTIPVEASVEAQRSGDGLQVSAAVPVTLTELGVSVPPESAVPVDDDATVEVRLQLEHATQPGDGS
ncbi:YceI family protein [Cellulosimicrobium arenosum]|uniref:YceI family protein n=1 Tax=Cellulosimicrobium arenosum TaxID=2708133 RepID=A0A927J2J6_9MICO|nr:YceI family protein [Cellulosimicrobium arenosum]MBD8080751.1 YceI family protein [Cellulosimicrobium arenosum]